MVQVLAYSMLNSVFSNGEVKSELNHSRAKELPFISTYPGHLNIASKSILVTSRFEDSEIIERCNSMNLRIIPKSMAGFVPIQFE